jgi:hypothetical protein
VAGRTGGVTGVSLSMTIAHTWAGDLHATLIAPGGTSHVLFGNLGATTPTGCGTANDLNGTYIFHDAAAGNLWGSVANPLTPGEYRTITPGRAPGGGVVTLMNPVFAGISPNGTWTLRLADSGGGETGTVTAASLVLQSAPIPPPTGTADAYSTPFQTVRTVPAPGVLGNDTNPPGGGALTAVVASLPTRGTLSLSSDGAFTYAPFAGVAGPDSFTYRPVNATGGPGNLTTVSLSVDQPTSPQPATELRVDAVAGNEVRLRWTAPAIGPSPTGYVVQGGVNPGQVLASIDTGHPYPVLTFTRPAGRSTCACTRSREARSAARQTKCRST